MNGGYMQVPSYIVTKLLTEIRALPSSQNTVTFNFPGAFDDLLKCSNTKKPLVGEGEMTSGVNKIKVIVHGSLFNNSDTVIGLSAVAGTTLFFASFKDDYSVTIKRIEIGG